MEEIRAFVAIETSRELQDALRGLQKQLREAPGGHSVRWVPPENMHLTLKFLGNIPRSRVDELAAALQAASAGIGPFTLTARGVGCFPNVRRPNVVWVGLEGDVDRVVNLVRRIEDEFAARGIAREPKPFSPHLTLGRVKQEVRPPDRAKLGDAIQHFPASDYGTMLVAAVHLVQSELRPSGSVYTQLKTISL